VPDQTSIRTLTALTITPINKQKKKKKKTYYDSLLASRPPSVASSAGGGSPGGPVPERLEGISGLSARINMRVMELTRALDGPGTEQRAGRIRTLADLGLYLHTQMAESEGMTKCVRMLRGFWVFFFAFWGSVFPSFDD
jgi:hypothetical protein